MNIVELLLIAVGLSMDAFAVSICKGLNMRRVNYPHALTIAVFFGGFQALMPLLGYFLGTRFERLIRNVDHWIAFGLLVFIGAKMLIEAIRANKDDSADGECDKFSIKELFVLAVATSIDALAVGITFAILPDTNIVLSVSLIGSITFILSFLGVLIGNKFGCRFKKGAEITGGVVLVLIGLKILFEHLGLISF